MNRLITAAFALLLAPQALADGETSYKTYCFACHGMTGAGDGVAGASLTPKPADFTSAEFWNRTETPVTDEILTKAIKEGGPAVGKSPLMAPWGGVLSDAQVAEVVEYIKTFKPAE